MRCPPAETSNQTLTNFASKPFLKWAGGKQRLLPTLLPLIPNGKRLIEPFVGAGAVSLSSNFGKYLINDANPDLVSVWVALKERPRDFIERSSWFFEKGNCSLDAYMRIRNEFNGEYDRFERAVRLIYLNRLGFNGMYRVNKSGAYNVPYGYPKKMPGFPAEWLERAALKMNRFEVRGGGYLGAIEDAGKGDVVYCDPPYLGKDGNRSSFLYTKNEFDFSEFQKLLEACERASHRGAKAVISQVDVPAVRVLLKDWECHFVYVQESIAGIAQARSPRAEVIARLGCD